MLVLKALPSLPPSTTLFHLAGCFSRSPLLVPPDLTLGQGSLPFPGCTHSPAVPVQPWGSINHLLTKNPTITRLVWTSFHELQTHMSRCLLDLSTWVAH